MLNVIINPINPTVIKFENEFDVGLSFSKMIYTNIKNHIVFLQKNSDAIYVKLFYDSIPNK